MKKNIFLFITLIHVYATAMEFPKPHLLMIPEQKALINQDIKTVLPYFEKNEHLVHVIETPEGYWYDFGQTRCQKRLSDKIDWLKKNEILHDNDPLIIHGSFRNSATAVNYAAKNHHNLKCLILESVILSGNSAIEQTFANVIGLPSTSANYYALPYATRVAHLFYSPTGEQPVKSVYDLPKDLLIIILHHPEDPCLPFEDAQVLYAFLTETQKNKNVYFFTQEGKYDNDDLLTKDDTEKLTAIETIWKKYNIIPSNPNELLNLDLKPYQPEFQQKWHDRFYTIFNKETNLKCVNSAMQYTIAFTALWALCGYFM